MSYCPHCGAEVFETDAFCNECGTSLLRGRRTPLKRPPAADNADEPPSGQTVQAAKSSSAPAAASSAAPSAAPSASPTASPTEPGPELPPSPLSGPVDDRYPALRMRRLRRAGSRRHARPEAGTSAGDAAPGPRRDAASARGEAPTPSAGAPEAGAGPRARETPAPGTPVGDHEDVEDMEDMEAATIVARPRFDDIEEPEPEASAPAGAAPENGPGPDPRAARARIRRRYAGLERGAAEQGVPADDAARPDPGGRGARDAIAPAAVGRDEDGRDGDEREEDWRDSKEHDGKGHDDDWRDEDERDDDERDDDERDDDDDESGDGGRARAGRPSDRGRGGAKARPRSAAATGAAGYRYDDEDRPGADLDDDALIDELHRTYSRAYRGRQGWSPGALWDSVRYAFRLARKTAGRTVAVRRLTRERAERERVRQDQLRDLGELALSSDALDSPLLDEYRDQLAALQKDQEMREDEVEALNRRIEEARREHADDERRRAGEIEELEGRIENAESRLRPVEADYRNALKKARAAEEDARALEQQIDRGKGELNQLAKRSDAEASEEAARLRARLERWSSEREGLQQEVPRLQAKAADLEPEIERLRQEAQQARQDLRDHRDAGLQKEAEHKREQQRLEAEVERIRVVIENLGNQRRTLYLDCGRQLDIDRPDHARLEESYQQLDDTAASIHRIDQEREIAQAKPDSPDWSALTRAGVALGGVFLILIILMLAFS